MPWKTLSLFRQRQQLIEALLARTRPVQPLYGRFGIRRKTAYQWLQRFRAQGRVGWHPPSRRPKRTPTRWPACWRTAVARPRLAHRAARG